MALPYFYCKELVEKAIELDETTSRHIVQVLRMKQGNELLLTDGKGLKVSAIIIKENKKNCEVALQSFQKEEQTKKVSIAISLIKNTSRFEWFLEKAAEIGVSEVFPLICDRTEKEKFRYDRLNGILISAMLQSQQCWLPVLHEPQQFEGLIKNAVQQNKFIAHCLPENKVQLSTIKLQSLPVNRQWSTILFVGPEGDFTIKEITLALENNFQAVALGSTRLRTETAGLVAAVLLCQ